MTKREAPESLDEIRRMLQDMPAADIVSRQAAESRQAQLIKPPGALGRLESLAAWIASWQGREDPHMDRPHIAVFAANHGIAAKGVSAFPPSVTASMVQAFIAGQAAINQLAALADAELRIYEMALDQPTGDISEGPAMDEDDGLRAIAYGMMAVPEGFSCMALGEMGIGNTTAAAAICAALFGGSGADWAGPGTGVQGEHLQRKIDLIDRALEVNKDRFTDPLAVLCALGGYEICAMTGAIVASRLAKLPVVLDGFVSTAAAGVLFAIDHTLLDHCLVAHRSAEPGHQRLLTAIYKEPLLDLGMRLGEASGAALALQVLKAACATHNGMATFEEAAVAGKSG